MKTTACLWLLMLLLVAAVGAAIAASEVEGYSRCTKFSSNKDAIAKQIDGKCYYGFTTNTTWSDARKLCYKEGMWLVRLETVAEQERVFTAFRFKMYWTSLRLLDKIWYWYASTLDKTPVNIDLRDRLTPEPGKTFYGLARTQGGENEYEHSLLPARQKALHPLVCEDDPVSDEGDDTVPFEA